MTAVPIATYPAAKYPGLAREGLCRLGKDWLDYANGEHASDNWRSQTDGFPDRRYGAVEHHYNYGKGTESVCHYCCDPLLERTSSGVYAFNGCNYDAILTSVNTISTGGTNVDGGGTLTNNVFINRQQKWDSPVWYNGGQYHGMFRNPHTQYPHKVMAHNAYVVTSGETPNQ